MPDPVRVLAFDIGIKNLAWCLLDTSGTKPEILGWQNYNLLAGEEAGTKHVKPACMFCKVSAAFYTAAGQTCLRHCPAGQPPLKDLSGVVQRAATLPVLRALAQGKKGTKVSLSAFLAPKFSFPIEKVKVKKAVDTDMATLHDSIRAFIAANLSVFRQATHICLENQPVLKNPTMKTVQILLYATLRDFLQPSPPVKLVHAGKKNTGGDASTGDAGYKTRKDAMEAKVVQILTQGKVSNASTHLANFNSHTKKSDLADALCMCLDFADIK
jgi:hypothetical protein